MKKPAGAKRAAGAKRTARTKDRADGSDTAGGRAASGGRDTAGARAASGGTDTADEAAPWFGSGTEDVADADSGVAPVEATPGAAGDSAVEDASPWFDERLSSGGGPDEATAAARPHGGRGDAEPLRAAWRPAADQRPVRERSQPTGLRRFTTTYGWRVYLVPVLLVVTALVVVDTTRGADTSAESGSSAGAGAASASAGTEAPVAEENPAEPVDLDIPTAELPPGGEYTESGRGSWHVIPLKEGAGERAGDAGPLYTYTVEVEDGIDPASYAGDHSFATAVERTLSDPRSWTGTGEVSLQRVDDSAPAPDFRVSLTTPETTKRPDICGASIPFEASCRNREAPGGDRVVINLARWVRGALAFSGDMTGYRQYAINHEVGHALNNWHEGCPEDGALAPVMMQQTFGVSNDYVAQLNNRQGGDNSVPADGRVCKPNGWPNPQAERN